VCAVVVGGWVGGGGGESMVEGLRGACGVRVGRLARQPRPLVSGGVH
jgi:hypothetical protein